MPQSSKQLLSLTVSVGQESRNGLAWWFWQSRQFHCKPQACSPYNSLVVRQHCCKRKKKLVDILFWQFAGFVTSGQIGFISPVTTVLLFLYYGNLSPHYGLYSGSEFWTYISHGTLKCLSMDMWQTWTEKLTRVEGFHEATQSSVTNIHPSIWKLIPLLMKTEILAKKEKCVLNKEMNQKGNKM